MMMKFDLAFADKEGRWPWRIERDWCKNRNPAKDGDCDIRSLLRQMSLLTWAEITRQRTGGKDRRKKHHPQALDSLVFDARKRWQELEREEDELFRFRGNGKLRLWGFRQVATFYIVWWDPTHDIYPVDR
ncbi:MAG: hypothetical protein ISN28_15760 [Ectothiorhodospiraceae bacterium AqS1]|nr:hypothetical protein [Ectothiorhodospiraceae bacterium AqS1]